MWLLSLVRERERKSESCELELDFDLQHFNANCVRCVHGPKLNQCTEKNSLTRNHKKWKYSWETSPSHVLRKPSKIVNLFMTSLHPSSFGMRWSIVWSSAFVVRGTEKRRNDFSKPSWFHKSYWRVRSISLTEEFVTFELIFSPFMLTMNRLSWKRRPSLGGDANILINKEAFHTKHQRQSRSFRPISAKGKKKQKITIEFLTVDLRQRWL